MKANSTGAVCLSCHVGGSVAPAVADAIEPYFSEDEAQDFNEGEIRSAFMLTKVENMQ